MAYIGPCAGGGDGTTASSTTCTLTFPAGAAAGDACVWMTQIAFTTPTCATPAGWTLLSGPNDNTTGQRSYMFGKLLDATDITTGSVTVTWSQASRILMVGEVVRGVDQTTPFGAPNFKFDVGNATLTLGTVATSVDNSDVLVFFGHNVAEDATMPGTRDVEAKTNFGAGTNLMLAASHYGEGPAGTYGGDTITTATASVNSGYVIAVNAVATGGGESGGTIGTPTAFYNIGFNNAPGATLPAAINDGDLGLMLIGINLSTTLTPPTGWTVIDGPVVNAAGNECVWLLTRVLTSGNAGQAIGASVAAGGRWGITGLVIPGGSINLDSYSNFKSAIAGNPSATTFSIPAITPTAANDLLVALTWNRFLSTSGITPPAGWTEEVDQDTASSPDFSVWTASLQLSGGAGGSQGPETMTGASAFYPNGYIVAVKPGNNTSQLAVWHFYDGTTWRPATAGIQ